MYSADFVSKMPLYPVFSAEEEMNTLFFMYTDF